MSEREDEDYEEDLQDEFEETEEETREDIEEEIDDYGEEGGILRYEGTRREMLQNIGSGAGAIALGGGLLYGIVEALDGDGTDIDWNNFENGRPAAGVVDEETPETGGNQSSQGRRTAQPSQDYVFGSLNDLPQVWCYPGPDELLAGYDSVEVDQELGDVTRDLEPVENIYAVDVDYVGEGYVAQLLGGEDSEPIDMTKDEARRVADLDIQVPYADCVQGR